MYKAKFISATYDNSYGKGWEHTELMYEYRGYTYFITKHNNGYMDKSLKVQHQEEQKRIDQMIEDKKKPIPEWKYEGSAQEGFDLFWNYLETGEYA